MKIFEGKVVSTDMHKTIVVEVFRKTPHPLYRKLVKLSKKFNVDNTGFENVEVGATVKITETRPISKNKYFKVSGIVGEKQIKDQKSNLKSDETDNNKSPKPKKKTVNRKTKIIKKEDKS